MKANEAPEKIWINPSLDLPKLNGVIDKDSVEYIRKDIVEGMLATAEVHAFFTGGESEREKLALKKDAFIEKACGWLRCQDEMIGISFKEDFIERFKDYMKGE